MIKIKNLTLLCMYEACALAFLLTIVGVVNTQPKNIHLNKENK